MMALNRIRSIYWKWSRCLASPDECMGSALRPWRSRIARRNPHRIFAIDVNNAKLGFFANLNLSLQFLYYCERTKLLPYISFSSPNYLDRRHGTSWFDYFFENLALESRELEWVQRGEVATCKVRNGRDLGLATEFNRDYYASISIELAHNLVAKYIGIRREIIDKVDRFANRNFKGKRVLAIHFRGTDKSIEAPRVSWEYCRATVGSYLRAHPEVDCLFVASDEAPFVDYMVTEFPGVTVCHHEDHQKSTGSQAIHLEYSSGENYHKGEDALMNCLLLARCAALIKSSSLLSAWASIFNPSLPVILLNRPHRDDDLWFPESELVRRSMNEYLPPPPHIDRDDTSISLEKSA